MAMKPKFYLILPDIRSCHNVGAMFRTGDAFGVDKIFLVGYTACPPKPQIDKVSLGAETWVPWEKRVNLKILINSLKKKGVFIVGRNAYGGKEYVTAENGFWTVNGDIFQTAEILGVAIDKWLNGEMDVQEIQDSYEKTLSRYTEEGEKENLLKIINQYKNERINELEGFKK
jgi:hypothetical protein